MSAGKARKHFVVQKVDLVPECGAYKQRIEKELRSLKPRENVEPPIGPYAIPDHIPAHLLPHLDSSSTAVPSSSSCGKKPSSRSGGGDVAARLQSLEQQIQEEREGRRLVEAQLERLQTLLQRFSPSSPADSATAGAAAASVKPAKGS